MINNETLYTSIDCDGEDEVFSIGFEYLSDESNLKILRSFLTTGEEDLLIVGVNYTIDVDTNEISTAVDVDSPYSADYKLTVLLDVPYTQLTDIVSNSNYDPEVLESAYDKNTLLAKQLKEEVTRTVKLAESDAGKTISLPPLESLKNTLLGFDEDGDIVSYTGLIPRIYNPTYPYSIDDITPYSGKFYKSLIAENIGNIPLLGVVDSNWELLTLEGMRWDENKIYTTGFFVEYGGYLFKSVAGGVNLTPTVPDGDANWTRVFEKGDTGEILPWDNTNLYTIDQVTSYSGKLYICLAANTGDTPDVSPSSWVVWGDTSSYKAALNALQTQQWYNDGKIVATDPQALDFFGASVSVSGDYAIVGAAGEGTGGVGAGAAYIFNRTGTNTWDTGVKIVATDPGSSDAFGISVSISGDYAIVGAKGESSNAGAAYIFNRTGLNTWDTGIKIVASDAGAFDYFGISVSISGDYAIVGAYGESGITGAAYIYNRTGTNTWDSGVKIVATDPEANDYFGFSVSISGDYAIVGATGEGAGGVGAGAAYIFNRTGTNAWDSGVKIVATDPDASDFFGTSVSISGDYAIVGASGEDTGGSLAGAAYIFNRTGTNTWDSGLKIVSTDLGIDDNFGTAVSISGDYAIVGANGESAGGAGAGAAYIFNRTGTNIWDTGVKIVATDPEADDYFGTSVSISGGYAIVGANGESAGGLYAGAAYMSRESFKSLVDLI